VWNELIPEKEQDIDVDIPVPICDRYEGNWNAWTYTPPKRNYADVKEVWFAGYVYLAISVTDIIHTIIQAATLTWVVVRISQRVFRSFLFGGCSKNASCPRPVFDSIQNI
jgi:hypothetical protein